MTDDETYATPQSRPVDIVRAAWRMLRDEGPRALARGVVRFVARGVRLLRWRLRPPTVTVGDHTFRIRHHRAMQPMTTERHLLETVADRCGEDATFWDVGANIGVYSLVAARHGVQVVAFEPDPRNRQDFQSIAGRSDRVHLVPVALSDAQGERPWITDVESGVRRLDPEGDATDTVAVGRGDEVDVPSPTGLKVDVEGHEAAVLDGMVETLRAVEWAIIEVHVDSYGVNEEAVRDRLTAAGLEVRERHERGRDIHLVASRR